MNVSESHKIVTMKDIEIVGNRLHFNTITNILFNTLAILLILRYSTKAMGVYKFFILMTVVGAFIMDFHTSFIFGFFTLFPLPLICSAGLMKHAGWFWGVAFQYVC